MREPYKPRKRDSTTITREYGYFSRIKTRKGKKRRQSTEYRKTRGEKVLLAKLGDLELYVYPKDYPDRVFLGIFPMSTCISEEQLGLLFNIYNKSKWYLKEDWTRKDTWRKGANSLRRRIQRSYARGLERQKKRRKDRFST